MVFLARLASALILLTGAMGFAGELHAASTIDPAQPAQGVPYSAAPIRQNFGAASNDINRLPCNPGVSPPSNPKAGDCWLQTPQGGTTYKMWVWDGRGNTWVPTGSIDTLNNLWEPPIGGGIPPSIVSAVTTDLGSVPQAVLHVTGVNTIQSFGASAPAGIIKYIIFDGTTTLIENPGSLMLPDAANIVTSPGDLMVAVSLGSGVWKSLTFQRGGVTGNVVGPNHTDLNEIASFANTSGDLLRQGAAQITDSKTTPIISEGYALGAFSQSGITANSIYQMTTNSPVNTYDAVRGVADQLSGSSITGVNGIAGYVLNNNPSTAGSNNAVSIFGVGIAAVDGASSWGINTVLSDNTSYMTSVGSGRTIYGAELDFNNTSSANNVVGVLLAGASLAQPNLSVGLHITPLNSFTLQFPWSIGYETDDAAATVGAQFGAIASAGNNIASQTVKWMYYNASGDLRFYTISANTAHENEMQFANQVFPGTFAFFGDLSLSAMAAPNTPASGRFIIYVDDADGKLYAKGPFGTVTLLASP